MSNLFGNAPMMASSPKSSSDDRCRVDCCAPRVPTSTKLLYLLAYYEFHKIDYATLACSSYLVMRQLPPVRDATLPASEALVNRS
jgi:hypothetical protein